MQKISRTINNISCISILEANIIGSYIIYFSSSFNFVVYLDF